MKKTAACRLIEFISLIALACLLPAGARAQLMWTTNAGTIHITGYNTNAPSPLTIPATISGLPVTEIDGVSGSPYLTSVTFGTNVTYLSLDAFSSCTALTNVTLDNNLQYVGSYAFNGCTALTNVSAIGSNVTSIGTAPFMQCTSLAAINVNTNNPNYAGAGGVLFDKALATLIQYPNGRTGNYTISNTVTTVQDWAFAYTAGLTNLTFGTSVGSIGYATFYQCTSLTNFTLPASVTTIGESAFEVCPSLTSVTIPNTVTSLGTFAFTYCTKLTSATIGSGVGNLGDGSAPFVNCPLLPAITVNAANPTLTSPGGVLYSHDLSLLIEYPGGKATGPYVISNTVTSVAGYAFDSCQNLTGVTIPNNCTNIGTYAFNYTALASVTVPNKVLAIGDDAFEFCDHMTNVIIGSSVQSIGNDQFYGDYSGAGTSLDFMLFMGNPPAYGSGDFTGATALTNVYYLPSTTGWGSTYDGLPTKMWGLPYPVIMKTPVGVQTNRFTFTIAWATNLTVIVQACTNLATPQWQPVQTNALTNDLWIFSDPKWTNSRTRFYRVYYP